MKFEGFGGPAFSLDLPVSFFKDPEHMLPSHGVESFLGHCTRRGTPIVSGGIRQSKFWLSARNDTPFDKMFQFPDIAGPMIGYKQRDRFFGNRVETLGEFFSIPFDKELGELGDVITTDA